MPHAGLGHLVMGSSIMIANNYSAATVVVLGTAHELVRGSSKGIFFDDGPGQGLRDIDIWDIE